MTTKNEVCCTPATPATREETTRRVEPRVDVQETGEEILLFLELPGVTPEGASVEMERGVLTVSARRTAPVLEGREPLLREFGDVEFYRRFKVGDGVDGTRVSARMSDGVLTVALPKSVEAKAQRIAIQG